MKPIFIYPSIAEAQALVTVEQKQYQSQYRKSIPEGVHFALDFEDQYLQSLDRTTTIDEWEPYTEMGLNATGCYVAKTRGRVLSALTKNIANLFRWHVGEKPVDSVGASLKLITDRDKEHMVFQSVSEKVCTELNRSGVNVIVGICDSQLLIKGNVWIDADLNTRKCWDPDKKIDPDFNQWLVSETTIPSKWYQFLKLVGMK